MRTNNSTYMITGLLAFALANVFSCIAAAQDAQTPPTPPPAVAAPPDAPAPGTPPSLPSPPMPHGAPFNVPLQDATYLGVVARSVDPVVTSQLKLVPGVGLAVAHVDGPADQADIKLNDILLQLDDQKLINPAQLAVLIRAHNAGDVVNVSLLRDGQPLEVKVTLGTAKLPPLNLQGDQPFSFKAPNIELNFDQAQMGKMHSDMANAHAELARDHVKMGIVTPGSANAVATSPAATYKSASHRGDEMIYTITVFPGQPPTLHIGLYDNTGNLYEGPIPPVSKWPLLPGKPEVTRDALNKLINLLDLEVAED